MTPRPSTLRSAASEQLTPALVQSFRSAGIDPQEFLALIADLAERDMPLDSLQVYRRGVLAIDYWRWPHAPQLPHMLHSATKSFTATAVGFARAEGLIDLDDTVVGFFQDRLPAVISENLARMRVRDLLTMRTGHARGLSGATTRLLGGSWVREFLAEPVVEAPGTSFVYSSSTSHMLSAIVQRVAGMPLSDYLRPRLFVPLGFGEHSWEKDPEGICAGGNGLSILPKDLLSFGRLYLQDGVWEGEQVLPVGWVAEAGTSHVARAVTGDWNGTELVTPPADKKASGGYGYQFWTAPDGVYSASGLFGQECMIFPQHDAVVAVTASTGDPAYHDVPDVLREHFLRAFAGHPESDGSDEAVAAVAEWVSDARAVAALSDERHADRQASYDFGPNDQGLRALVVDIHADVATVEITDDRGVHEIQHGLGHWISQRSAVSAWRLHHSYQGDAARILAGAQWIGDATLELTWHFLETPFVDTITVTFGLDEVTVGHRVNLNSGPTELKPTIGALRKANTE